MKKVAVLLAWIGVFFFGATIGCPAWAASLENTDNQTYDLVITEPGYRQDFRHPYQILSHSKVEICIYGCELLLRSTGQVVRVGPDDALTISWGVVRVERSWRNTP